MSSTLIQKTKQYVNLVLFVRIIMTTNHIILNCIFKLILKTALIQTVCVYIVLLLRRLQMNPPSLKFGKTLKNILPMLL